MSDLEHELLLQLRAVGLNPKRQYQFHPQRKFRADFAWPEHRLIVEVMGATWIPNTGHTSGRGIQRDYEKSNLAQLMGYTYLQFTREDIENGTALSVIEDFIMRSGMYETV